MLTKDTFWGKILAFIAAGTVCGLLVAGLFVPATALGATAASGSIGLFDQLPGELDVNAPAQSSKVRLLMGH